MKTKPLPFTGLETTNSFGCFDLKFIDPTCWKGDDAMTVLPDGEILLAHHKTGEKFLLNYQILNNSYDVHTSEEDVVRKEVTKFLDELWNSALKDYYIGDRLGGRFIVDPDEAARQSLVVGAATQILSRIRNTYYQAPVQFSSGGCEGSTLQVRLDHGLWFMMRTVKPYQGHPVIRELSHRLAGTTKFGGITHFFVFTHDLVSAEELEAALKPAQAVDLLSDVLNMFAPGVAQAFGHEMSFND